MTTPSDQWKPQWAYPTPDGYRDEPFVVPFTFTVLADGFIHKAFPWHLDDDVPYLIRAILFSQVGTGVAPGPSNPGSFGFPALMRITETHGNPLSQTDPSPLCLTLGAWCQSPAFNGAAAQVQNAFGFPIEPEIECAPGGTILFDFQISTTAVVAFFSFVVGAETIIFSANVFGVAGNAIQIHVINGAALAIAVVGTAVTVTLNTGVSTLQDVANIINSTPAAAALIIATLSGGAPLTVMVAFALTNLSGGTAATPITLLGSLLGCKRFPECL